MNKALNCHKSTATLQLKLQYINVQHNFNFDMLIFFSTLVSYLYFKKLLWNNWMNIYSKKSETSSHCGSQSVLLFCFTCLSLIYFPDIYINAKYK